MADVLPSQLANSVMGKLYDVLTNGDDTVPKSEDNFFAWCTPGIPIEASDFEFLTQGFTGVIKKKAVDELTAATGTSAPTEGGQPAATPGLTPEQLKQLLAQDVGRLYMQAENFARLVDFVPDTRSGTLNIMHNEGTLSDRYEYILRFSQVMASELPDETKKKVEKFRSLLTVKTKKKNLIDDTETEVDEPSPLVKLYNEKLKAYEDAVLEYNARRIDALTADDPKAIHFWAMNANTLRNRVRAAMSDWVSNGYKNDYEAIAAFLDQVMQRDMSLLKAEYRDLLERARLTGVASGSPFYFTSVVPASWVTSSGWTGFSFHSGHHARYEKATSNKWSARGSFLGLFSAGAAGSGSRQEFKGGFNAEEFRLSFYVTQVPIIYNYLRSAFLVSHAWRFDPTNPDAKGQMLNDGGDPPQGMLPAYPTSMVCIKDLTLSWGKSSGVTEFMQRAKQAGGGFSFGPFAVGGSYSAKNSERKTESTIDSQGMTVKGMQIIGFKCHVLPKSPNPSPSITQWV